ncbi:hypothetical protein N7470_000499 [Penicillium chermesinum]|nr:hypothetical protein N7470_000499 [Penicillium chermesinum]
MPKPAPLELPEGVRLEYLAEGGANVIYRFVATPVKDAKWPVSNVTINSIEHSSLPRNYGANYSETTVNTPYKEIAQNFNSVIRPLFSQEELVDQTLIRLPEGLIHRYNEQLRLLEISGRRPKKRHGGYLAVNEPFGLLITDMTAFDEPGTILAEFKPKWLTQSPSAPALARRCRTCALREMKNHEAREVAAKEQRSFCPLDLVSEHYEHVFRATAFIAGCNDRARLAHILYSSSTLRKLQSRQKASGKVGLYGPTGISQTTSLGMTLRDCTMFVKIPRDEKSPVEIRLGDLDLKCSTGGKAEYWKYIELQLIDGGWYHGSHSSQTLSNCSLRNTPATNRAPVQP